VDDTGIEPVTPTMSMWCDAFGIPLIVIADVTGFAPGSGDAQLARSNRICQPPQLLQGWTIAAFNWFKQEKFL